jgi:hypothetical protein
MRRQVAERLTKAPVQEGAGSIRRETGRLRLVGIVGNADGDACLTRSRKAVVMTAATGAEAES